MVNKFINAWLGAWYRLFPGIRRHMEQKYGREQGLSEAVQYGMSKWEVGMKRFVIDYGKPHRSK